MPIKNSHHSIGLPDAGRIEAITRKAMPVNNFLKALCWSGCFTAGNGFVEGF
jgi:hypothetical protein